jgi:CRP/FNR family transcriptional regulator, cyclic AMP receptor protein
MINGTQYWYLKDHRLFSHLNSEALRQVCFISSFKTAKKGEIIFFSTDNKGLMFSLKKGNIKIVKVNEDGTEQIKDILKKGDLFGQLSLDTEVSNDEYAVVISDDAVLCSFESEIFSQYLETNPNIALKYTKWMGFWFKRLENRYANIMFKDVRARLLSFLKDSIHELPQDENGLVKIPNILTHQDVASLICSTRQTVTTLFNNFKNEGVLDYNRKEIIVDFKKFQNLNA